MDQRPEDLSPEELMMLNRNEPCFCGSGSLFGFCCYRIANNIVDALMLADRGRFTAALKTLAAAEPAPGSAEIHGIRAQVYAIKGDYDACEAELQTAFEINPDYPRGYYLRGNLLIDEGRFADALEMYDRALELYPPQCRLQVSEVYCQKGFCYFDLRDYEKAKAVWRQGVELNPEEYAIPTIMKEHIYENTDLPESITRKDEFYYKCIAPNIIDDLYDGEELPDDMPDADEEDIPDGEELENIQEDFLDEMDIDPVTLRDIRRLRKKAETAAEKGKFKKAIEHLEEALELNPMQPDALLTLHMHYRQIGQHENAADCLFELQEIVEDPAYAVVVVGAITLNKLVDAIADIFPHTVQKKSMEAQGFKLQTSELAITSGKTAIEQIEQSPYIFNKRKIRNSGMEYVLVADEKLLKMEKPESDMAFLTNLFFLRVYPETDKAYFDCSVPEKFDEFIGIARGFLGNNVSGAPSAPYLTATYAPNLLEEFDFDYESEVNPPREKSIPLYERFPVAETEIMEKEFVQKFFDDIWPNSPVIVFDDLTPSEAMDEEELMLVVKIVVSNMAEAAASPNMEIASIAAYDFNRLREKLGLPPE